MLSRVESIEQLFILESFNEAKIYGSQTAINEFQIMNKKSVNEKSSIWLDSEATITRVSSLNCGSLRNQIENIKHDEILKQSDAICLQETWIWENEDTTNLELYGFRAHHAAVGKGKGISIYYKDSQFTFLQEIITENIQLVKLSGNSFDLITVYKAPKENDKLLQDQIQLLIDDTRSTVICGDFNLCFIDNINCKTLKMLRESGFHQIVKEATHIHGGHLDHAHLRSDSHMATVELYSPYFTAKDHDALCILIEDNQESNSQ